MTDDAVWVASTLGDAVMRIDPATDQVTDTIELDGAVLVRGWRRFAARNLSDDGAVVLIDPASGQVDEQVDVDPIPRDPGFVDGLFWVPHEGDGDISLVDPAIGEVVGKIESGEQGIFVAEGLLGDGWVLDFNGTSAFRVAPDAGR